MSISPIQSSSIASVAGKAPAAASIPAAAPAAAAGPVDKVTLTNTAHLPAKDADGDGDGK